MENPFQHIIEKMNDIENLIYRSNSYQTNVKVEYLQVNAAAEFLSITPNAVRVLVHRNLIPHIKKLGKNYFLKADLIDWLEEGRVMTEDEIITLPPKKRKAKRRNAA